MPAPHASSEGSAATIDLDVVAAVVRSFEDLRSNPDLVLDASLAARGVDPTGDTSFPLSEIHRHVDAMVRALIAMVRGDPDQEAAVADAAAMAADRAAQGVPLEYLLAGMQESRGLMIEEFLRRTRDVIPPDQLGALLVVLDRLLGGLQNSMVLAHQAAERDLARMTSTVRVEALRMLLARARPSSAQELGLDPDRQYRCLVADVSTPREAQAVDVLLTTPDGVSGLVQGYLCRVTSLLPPAERLGGVLVVTSPPVPVGALPDAHTLCRRAIGIGRARGHLGMHPITEYALDLAIEGQEEIGGYVVAEFLGGLDRGDEFHHQLAATGFAYLSHGRRGDATAAALHVHPNTVAHRLRRLADLTGFPAVEEGADSFVRTAHWWWALRRWLRDPT